MKTTFKVLALTSLLSAFTAHADTVVREVPDNTVGGVYGGLSGFLIGGAAGGPLGALIGGGISWYAGQAAQESVGLSGRAYEVDDDTGELRVVRSPNSEWEVGDEVVERGRRLAAN